MDGESTTSDRGSGVYQAPCGACKHQSQTCGVTCIFAPYFPSDDAFSERIFASLLKTYTITQLRELITGLPNVEYHQHDDADSSKVPDFIFQAPVVNALTKEINTYERRIKVLQRMRNLIFTIRKLRSHARRDPTFLRVSDDQEGSSKIKMDIDINKDPN